jgi:beta-lactam-binding protein with PASTA domain
VPRVPRTGQPAWRERRTVAVAAIGVLLLVAGILAAVAASREPDEPDSVADSVAVATVPTVAGLETAEAEAALRRAGLASAVERKDSRRPEGTVIGARPRAGSRVERGAAILLIVSTGKRPARGSTTTEDETGSGTEPPAETEQTPTLTDSPSDTVIVEPEPELSEVPGVLHIGYVESARRVEEAGFVAETYPVASKRLRGMVVRQVPDQWTPWARGRTVRLYVSVGTGERGAVELTDYSGLPERQARELLERAGFTVRVIQRPAPSRKLLGKVLRQAPAAGRRMPVLSQIVLYVGR